MDKTIEGKECFSVASAGVPRKTDTKHYKITLRLIGRDGKVLAEKKEPWDDPK